jgi:hypothetical protein
MLRFSGEGSRGASVIAVLLFAVVVGAAFWGAQLLSNSPENSKALAAATEAAKPPVICEAGHKYTISISSTSGVKITKDELVRDCKNNPNTIGEFFSGMCTQKNKGGSVGYGECTYTVEKGITGDCTCLPGENLSDLGKKAAAEKAQQMIDTAIQKKLINIPPGTNLANRMEYLTQTGLVPGPDSGVGQMEMGTASFLAPALVTQGILQQLTGSEIINDAFTPSSVLPGSDQPGVDAYCQQNPSACVTAPPSNPDTITPTPDYCTTNPTAPICQTSVLSPDEAPYGGSNPALAQMACAADKSECYPDPDEQKVLKAQGWQCSGDASTGDAVCTPPYQGPCQDGQPVNPATGQCTGQLCGLYCPVGQQVSSNCSCIPNPDDPRLRQCPTGYMGTPPNCIQLAGCQGNQCNRNNTFGNPSNPSSSQGGQQSPSSSAPPPPPQPPAPTQPTQPPQSCSTDPNAYAQQQQQYQTALQQYNYQQQQYNYQLQLSQYNQQYYGQSSAPPAPPAQPQACTPSTQQQCSVQPAQPDPSQCTSGMWTPVMNGSCITNYNCSSQNAGAPIANLSCQPDVADVGMKLAISYSCSSGTATGNGFNASGQSGTSTTLVKKPPTGTNTATYSLACANSGQTAGAQCSVQIESPSIVLAANPKTVTAGDTSQIGWITTAMKSCTIATPQDQTFNDQNSSNTSVNGTATTDAITGKETFTLTCTTDAGQTKTADVVVGI